MGLLEGAYLLSGAVLAVVGLIMVGEATRAYVETQNRSMLALVLGFTLVVAAVIATVFSGYISDFQNPRLLLTVNFSITSIGFLFIVASLIIE